ncbi:Winged helix DNA-binding domain-containing protein [Georgenia satyanarayanai]|uniref:Winged helix DNA-binding domain-containing protein n=1 Tax=Georgenia satyanarayanai TaxID=860221 RepID=A0A2Y9A2H0_9MICO|nr:winged helix DNA-binding domain-containing protein [Georgenia satyanarayanai]PYG01896.1 winged helix DNA-binding protein [Georgenia satyanarayanai]SSA36699.1 Winged helix DNA-binding domain-containing protein [Georgenia satyanarayanai]
MRHIDDTERRSRLAIRHALHPAHRLADPVAATRAMTVLHATEPSTVHLAVHARTEGVAPDAVDHALYEDRSLVKQLAMRRTLFVFPRDLLPAALGSASARTAAEQRRVIARDVEKYAVADDGAAWRDAAASAVLAHLATSGPLPAREIREQVPEMAGRFTTDLDKKYGGTFQIGPRVLTMLGAEGRIVRAHNAGHWRIGRPTWTLMESWLGERPTPLPADDGYAAIVRRWLATFGPGTVEDVQWWLGSTKAAARAALAAVGAVEVSLDGGQVGWVLPEDEAPVAAPEPWAALLPTLDPTTMGWKGRSFYLDPDDTPYLFDTNGNAGNTAWWDGRIVGAWVQDDDGVVKVVLHRDVSTVARSALDAEAARLTAWLDGVRISNVYSSLVMKQGRLP